MIPEVLLLENLDDSSLVVQGWVLGLLCIP
jgi:hypothetical protein